MTAVSCAVAVVVAQAGRVVIDEIDLGGGVVRDGSSRGAGDAELLTAAALVRGQRVGMWRCGCGVVEWRLIVGASLSASVRFSRRVCLRLLFDHEGWAHVSLLLLCRRAS